MHNRRFGMAARRRRSRSAGRARSGGRPFPPGAKIIVRAGRLLYPVALETSDIDRFGDLVSGQTLKIGTRKSAMALAQTEAIARLLRAADPALDVEIVEFENRSDQDQAGELLRHGGEGGAFVAEIREAIRAEELQAAMHSLKDIPGNEETPGLIIAAMLPRDAANDALGAAPRAFARRLSCFAWPPL